MNPVSVVVPALNEAQSIGSVLEQIKRSLESAKLTYEIIVIDDGSTDRTGEIAKSFQARVLRHPIPGGYGLSLKDGILNSKYNIVAIIDADGTYPPEKLPEMVGYMDEFDMVVGARSRAGKFLNHSFFKGVIRMIFHFLCEFVTGRRIQDVNSGFRVFKKDLALQFKENFCLGYSFTTTITLAFFLNGYFVKYIPIQYFKRQGKSHVRLIKDSLIAAQIIVQTILYYNPIKLFLLLSLIMGFGAVISFAFDFFSPNSFSFMLGQTFLLMVFVYFGMGFLAEILRGRRSD